MSSAALAFSITQAEYTKRTTGALRLAFINERMPVKRLAEVAQSSIATAKNWWEQRNPPEGLYQLRLLAAVPEYAAEVRRLTNMQANLDPEFERDLSRLFTQWQRVRGQE
ncbi:MAG TPA: hypothetical protein VD994_10550 [Prosthecobacter sp.]|nr:hypothetical protein [Prosthecobacter sp.]